MSETIIVAIISASASMLTAIVALLLNYRLFGSLERSLGSLERRIERIEIRIDHIENDLKEFYRMMADQDKRIHALENNKS